MSQNGVRSIKTIGACICLLVGSSLNASSCSNAVDGVSAALAFVHRTADPADIEEVSVMNASFELRFEPSIYMPLVRAMSNCWREVLRSLDSYATNRVDRMLVANTGWWYGEDEYIGYVDALSGLVSSNRISSVEFDAFEMAAWNNHTIASSLCRRYNEPAVSNLVHRILSFSSRSNKWARVMSGEAKRCYEEQVAEGLWR